MDSPRDYSDAVKRFESIAKEYCSLVDSVATLDRSAFLFSLYGLLPRLITEGIRLPTVEFEDDEDDELRARMPANKVGNSKHEEWSQLYNALKEKLGDWDLYWVTFDPRTDAHAIRGSLADDIADIYRELKPGIASQDPPHDILFEWRIGFYIHWGRHAINALRTIHFLLAEHLGA